MDIVLSAQTERRGDAGPVSVLLRGWDSPAAFFQNIEQEQMAATKSRVGFR
jgi:hypothetical protein